MPTSELKSSDTKVTGTNISHVSIQTSPPPDTQTTNSADVCTLESVLSPSTKSSTASATSSKEDIDDCGDRGETGTPSYGYQERNGKNEANSSAVFANLSAGSGPFKINGIKTCVGKETPSVSPCNGESITTNPQPPRSLDDYSRTVSLYRIRTEPIITPTAASD